MKILIRVLMLVAVIAGLIAGYYWMMQRHAGSSQPPIEIGEHQILLDEKQNEYIKLAGELVYDDGLFYIKREDGSKVAVSSQQVDLYMFRNRQVEAGARFVKGKLDVFRIEER